MTSPSCKHGMSDAASCKWKAKFAGLDISDARGPNALKDTRAKPEARCKS